MMESNLSDIKVSVLMLAYNQERYIDEAIRSVVLQQTSFPIELIVADDASTDHTLDRIHYWQRRYPERMVVLPPTENLGLAANFIRAYSHARGEYVAICEGDDFWTDKRKLQIQADFMDTHPEFAMCFHRVVNFYEADGSKSLSNGHQKRIVGLSDIALCNPITNVSVFYRRKAAGSLPEWMNRVTSYDFVMHMMCATHGNVYYMKRPMAVYRKLATSIWTGGDKARRSMISLKNRDLLIDFFKQRNADVCAILRLANARNCIDLALYYEANGDTRRAQETLSHVQTYQPDWTEADISREKAAMAAAQHAPSLLKRALTACRKVVSRLLPLPRIRQ